MINETYRDILFGGVLFSDVPQFDDILMAIINFQNTNTDPKVQIEAGFKGAVSLITFYIAVFYDCPTAPDDISKEFLDIHHRSMLETRSYLSLIEAISACVSAKMR